MKTKLENINNSERYVRYILVSVLGCGILYVMDGNWKLCYSHCMFPTEVKISGFEKDVNYPNVCPMSPIYNSAFCEVHNAIMKKKQIPTRIKDFLLYCKDKKQGICMGQHRLLSPFNTFTCITRYL